MREKWLPVKGFESFYEVSNLGRVRSKAVLRNHGGYRPRRMKQKILAAKKRGKYTKIMLWGADGHLREVRVHVLVAEHFVPNPQGFKLVCHKDDHTDNNKASNLVWGTPAHNTKHAVLNDKLGRLLTVADAKEIKRRLALPGRTYGKYPPIAAAFGVSISTVCAIKQGRLWKHV